jgi:hypothetical protein
LRGVENDVPPKDHLESAEQSAKASIVYSGGLPTDQHEEPPPLWKALMATPSVISASSSAVSFSPFMLCAYR